MSEEKITVTASDLPTSYVPYTNDDVNAIYYPTRVATKCTLCDNDFPVSAFSTNFVTICPRCKRVWKKFLEMYDDGGNHREGAEN